VPTGSHFAFKSFDVDVILSDNALISGRNGPGHEGRSRDRLLICACGGWNRKRQELKVAANL
jgi:hypothetical protein